jgi:hypothetical protein
MISKSQQLRVATALAGVAVPPKGSALVRQSDQRQRVDRVTQADERATKRADKARRASVSVRSGGGGESAPAPESKGSLRAEIRSAMER